MFRLEVTYPLEKFDMSNESVIHGIVGRPTTSAGTNLITLGRDLSYEFKDKREAKKALGRLKSSRYKWMKMTIEQD